MNYWEKFDEAEFNLNALKLTFEKRNSNFEHLLNNFLVSAQGVLHVLTNAFESKPGYKNWADQRSGRLSENAKIFKELRNVSLKEAPIRHESITMGLDFGPGGVVIYGKGSVTTPMLNIVTGEMSSNKAVVDMEDGSSREVDVNLINDFSVRVESKGEEYFIDDFIKNSKAYLEEIRKELNTAEETFLSS